MNEDGVTSPNLKSPSSPPTLADRPLSLLRSAGASSPAFPTINGESRRHGSEKSNADSQLMVDLVQGALNRSCRPWERSDFLRRLSTFKLAGKKPKVAGSLACAKRGWVNVDVTKIECELCNAQLDFALLLTSFEAGTFSEEISKLLDKGHKVTCPWRGNSCPESLVQFPPTSSSALIGGFKDRCDGLLQFYSLPIVSSSAVEQMQVTHSPQIDRFLARLQVPTTGELGYRVENVSGMGVTGEQALHSYSYAQKLISLCGWEPRWLPNVLDCEEHSAESAKHGYSSGPAKGSAPDPALRRKEFSASSRKDAGDNDVLGSEFNCESRSPLLDCSLCSATVRVWEFLTVPRPVHLAPCGIDTPQASKKMASTRGISAASGINERAAADGFEKEHTGDRDDAATSDKRQLVSKKSLDLNLKMASRPSCSTPDHMLDANIGRELMIGRPSGSEVGDRAVSYESQGPNARKRRLEDGGITAARPHLGTQQADSAETTKIDREYDEIIAGQQFSTGPSKRSRDTNLSGNFQFPFRKTSGGVPSNLLDVQIEAGTNKVNQLNTERDHVIGNLSTRDSAHTSSIIAMNTVYHSSDDESIESVENIPVSDNAVNFPSVDLNETSELNNSYRAQQSVCFQPLLDRAVRETGVSSSNASGEVLNTEILTAHVRDGPSFGISGGSVGMGASHEAEMHGTDTSVHRGDILGDVEPIAEVIENQGQAGQFVPYHGLAGDFVPEEMSREDNQGDSQAVVSQSTPRTVSGSKLIVSTKVEFVESGEKPSGSMQMPGYENSAHPSLSCNAVVCSAYEVSKEEVTQTRKGSHNDDGACYESGYLSADVVGTPYRDNTNGGVEFNPIKLHNDYCPWVNGDVAVAGSDSPFSSSGVGTVALCGWQLTLDALDSFQSLGHLPVQTLESESAASMCKGDQLTSTQKLLAHNSCV
ncbi:PREDICTED: uncharacterized protein LOC109357142 [Lupinus angustifolius]|uniref:uncharacterized protein LOC109357142 n=1 Tax=Lupinus angustifolius TaxID=3871 RepID=UPI00092ED544|nr:PREDICTED: uncharacterized protein LOC109357142 [Lupinus angustifolius]